MLETKEHLRIGETKKRTSRFRVVVAVHPFSFGGRLRGNRGRGAHLGITRPQRSIIGTSSILGSSVAPAEIGAELTMSALGVSSKRNDPVDIEGPIPLRFDGTLCIRV